MPRPSTYAALAAFLVVDAVLVVGAVRAVRSDPPPSDIAAEPSAAPDPSDEQQAFEFDPAAAAVLDVANDGTTVFATRGSCESGGGTVLTATSNDAPLEARRPPVSVVLAAEARTGGDITLVGTTDDCVPVQVTSTDGGASWVEDDSVTQWYPAPDDVRAVVAPDGTRSSPDCTVTSVSPIDASFARVSCVDGVVRGTGNAGAEWLPLGRLDNLRAVTFTNFTAGYALARFAGCAAQIFRTDDSGQTWEQGACVVGDPARGIALNDTLLLVAVGPTPEVYLSDDEGDTISAR